jgi:hypothetical protein
VGARALKGELEGVNTKLFNAGEYPRTITGKGMLVPINFVPLSSMLLLSMEYDFRRHGSDIIGHSSS